MHIKEIKFFQWASNSFPPFRRALKRGLVMDYWIARTYAAYANLFKKERETTKAKEYRNKAIEIFKQCGANEGVEKYEKELASLE